MSDAVKSTTESDEGIQEEGQFCFLTHTISSENIEKWVEKIQETSGQQVDWHYVGGRARVLAKGDLDKVLEAIQTHRDFHDEKFQEDTPSKDSEEIEREIEGIWSFHTDYFREW